MKDIINKINKLNKLIFKIEQLTIFDYELSISLKQRDIIAYYFYKEYIKDNDYKKLSINVLDNAINRLTTILLKLKLTKHFREDL